MNIGLERAVQRLSVRRGKKVSALAEQFGVSEAEIIEILGKLSPKPQRKKRSVINAADQETIQRLHESVPVPVSKLARMYGVTQQRIHAILAGYDVPDSAPDLRARVEAACRRR